MFHQYLRIILPELQTHLIYLSIFNTAFMLLVEKEVQFFP